MEADPKAGIQHPQFQQLKHKARATLDTEACLKGCHCQHAPVAQLHSLDGASHTSRVSTASVDRPWSLHNSCTPQLHAWTEPLLRLKKEKHRSMLH